MKDEQKKLKENFDIIGRIYYNGNFILAEVKTRSLIKKYNKVPILHNLLGMCLGAQNKTEESKPRPVNPPRRPETSTTLIPPRETTFRVSHRNKTSRFRYFLTYGDYNAEWKVSDSPSFECTLGIIRTLTSPLPVSCPSINFIS